MLVSYRGLIPLALLRCVQCEDHRARGWDTLVFLIQSPLLHPGEKAKTKQPGEGANRVSILIGKDLIPLPYQAQEKKPAKRKHLGHIVESADEALPHLP